MKTLKDYRDQEFLFLPERWAHITTEHPEVLAYKDEIEQTLIYPELVKKSRRDPRVLMYYKFFRYIFGGKFLLIVARTGKPGLVLTVYITDHVKQGDEVWHKG